MVVVNHEEQYSICVRASKCPELAVKAVWTSSEPSTTGNRCDLPRRQRGEAAHRPLVANLLFGFALWLARVTADWKMELGG